MIHCCCDGGVSKPCSCTGTKSPDTIHGFFNDGTGDITSIPVTYRWSTDPSFCPQLGGFAGFGHAFYVTDETFTITDFGHTYHYKHIIDCGGHGGLGNYEIRVAFLPDAPGGIPFGRVSGVTFYWRLIDPGNTCDPFHFTQGHQAGDPVPLLPGSLLP